MATIQAQTTANPDVDASDAFAHYIESDRAICNSCFRRPIPETTDGTDVESKGASGERCTRHQDGRVTGTTHVNNHSAQYRFEGMDVCPHCGQPGLSSPTDTLGYPAARDRAFRLSDRLHEAGIAHDAIQLWRFVRIMKHEPRFAGRDREIVAKATTVAIEEWNDER